MLARTTFDAVWHTCTRALITMIKSTVRCQYNMCTAGCWHHHHGHNNEGRRSDHASQGARGAGQHHSEARCRRPPDLCNNCHASWHAVQQRKQHPAAAARRITACQPASSQPGCRNGCWCCEWCRGCSEWPCRGSNRRTGCAGMKRRWQKLNSADWAEPVDQEIP